MVRQEVSVLFGGTGVWCLVCHHEIQFQSCQWSEYSQWLICSFLHASHTILLLLFAFSAGHTKVAGSSWAMQLHPRMVDVSNPNLI